MLTGEDNGLEKQKLVMMPGWSMDSSVWKPVVAALSEYFQLIFCEWHGITGMEGYTERVCKLIEKEKDKLCLLGWSLGSLLAIDAAGKYKDRVEKLVLVGGTARFTRDKETGYFCGWHKSAVKKMKEAIKVHREKTMDSFYSSLFSSKEQESKEYVALFKVDIDTNTASFKELEAGLDFLLAADMRMQLESIKADTLIIHGEMDSICPKEAALYMAQRMKNKAQVFIMEGIGHVPFYSLPEEFTRLILEFMKQGDKSDR
ncbi:MAG TPA: pimeloyl-CoA synthetase [Hungateiclostridium thermocellum]|jgi:pimeloyl-[acyl-carrier protein] methyl ester esterase|uniref:Carboxylesterase n=1 Tax=Acetivibrio thermocellus (strain ATCC 27405 / DSM 1237 / JCM 9322 / NBRC 103400 / NCIMB 10682 / NRRL B-4536 / VPI 7372) TaxID=203119 RepID=A3DBD6_ACET2|nr:Carboxylesterase [Acetivibrio thermocellus ATCC 27405]NLU27852.1 alpha/beta fold hydrolase [Acetivibrio thermocellus]HBW26647.1 pimeloyl-CoA synthetase [Acetivibrio thermocellus]